MNVVYGFNAHSLRNMTQKDEQVAVPLSAQRLKELGVPEGRIPRVQEELARLALQDNRLLDRELLEQMAVELSKRFKSK